MAKKKQQQKAKTAKAQTQKGNSKKTEKKETQSDHSHVTLLTHPILSIKVLVILMGHFLRATFDFIINHIQVIIGLISLIAAFFYAPGPHVEYRSLAEEIVVFASWWIGLGIASSIGFGTGLHTFVLYLGPHIAKVTMASNACNYVPDSLPSRWAFHHFKQCPEFQGVPTISAVSIYQSVIIEAFLWGLGTAIGELPPYYVARAASLAGKKSEELEELQDEARTDQSKLPFSERLKVYIYKTLKKNAFITILILASVPNPLFDLAGFLCGHFLVPFAVFFGATFIGKAIVKVSIQSFFVIFCFSQHQVDLILTILADISPSLQQMISKAIQKQKNTLFAEKLTDEARPLVAVLWEYFVIAMVAYFIYSIICSLVQNYLNEEEDKKKDKKVNTGKQSKLLTVNATPQAETIGTETGVKEKTMPRNRSVLDTRLIRTPLSVNSPQSGSNQLTRIKSEHPTSSILNQGSKQQHMQQVKASPYDFVCTSEACFRIKKKMASVGFSKQGNSSTQPQVEQPGQTNQKPSQFSGISQGMMGQQQQRRQVSPNMMLKKTKSAKEIKIEKKIKELFENDPLDLLKQQQDKQRSLATAFQTNGGSFNSKHEKAFNSFITMNIQKEAKGILNPDHIKLISDFNVPLHKYNKLQTEEEKSNLILEHVQSHMKNLIKQLNDLHDAKQKNDQQRISEINKRFQNDKGLYAWLQVCTPHTSLHKKLRKALIEKFQSEDIDPYKKENKMPLGFLGETSLKNQQVLIDSSKALRSGAALSSFIEHTFDEFVDTCQAEIEQEKATNKQRPSFWQFNKTTADTLKLINSKNVDKLKPMFSQESAKKKKRVRPRTAKPAAEIMGSTLNQSQSQPLFETGMRPMSGFNRGEGAQFLSPEIKKFLLKKEKMAKSKQLSWNEIYEKQFGEHKTEMRIRLADLSSTNSWNQVVLGSFIKLFTQKPKAIEPNLFEEYKNLEYSKVKKIVSSIPSLNECIDKEYFQSIIDKMNKKKIDQVETHISNQVILDYEKEKEKSKVARFKYLKKKADVKGSMNKHHDQDLDHQKEKDQRKAENVQAAKRFRVILKGLDNNFITLKTRQDHEELNRYHKPKMRGLYEPLEIPAEQTEAYRNKVVYDYFKDCPDKPRFTINGKTEYFLKTTTGGPIMEIKRQKALSQDQIARAALKIQRAIRRWKRRREEAKRLREIHQVKVEDLHNRDPKTFFVTQSSKNTGMGSGNDQTITNTSHKDSRAYTVEDESMRHQLAAQLDHPNIFQSALNTNERALKEQQLKKTTTFHKSRQSNSSMVTFNLNQLNKK